MPNRDIPEKWIRSYVDKLIALAKILDNGSVMQTTLTLMRAEHAMDLVNAFRESDPLRCPKCGYTADDAALHLDHHLCKGTIPSERVNDAKLD